MVTDGYKVLSVKELEKWHSATFKIPNRGLAVFPRRAVLRIGMLLRDSEVAKLVRSYLLNVEKEASSTSNDQYALKKMANQLDQHAAQLIENAVHLTEHANQLTTNASGLKNQAEQLHSQTRMIKAVVDEIYLNRNRIQKLESEVHSNKQKIDALEKLKKHQHFPIENSEETISAEQIKVLKERVKEKGEPLPIWREFKKHFDLSRYFNLPKSKFREALDWLENYKK